MTLFGRIDSHRCSIPTLDADLRVNSLGLEKFRGGTLPWKLQRLLGNFEIEPPIYENFVEKIKYIRTNGQEMDSCICTEFCQFDVINASTTYTNIQIIR